MSTTSPYKRFQAQCLQCMDKTFSALPMQRTISDINTLIRQAWPEVVSAIRQASNKTGVDFDYLLQNAAVESSLDPAAGNQSSSARGLYQFIDSTWLDMVDKHGGEHGLATAAAAITRDGAGNPVVANAATKQQILALRNNPQVAALMAAEFTQDNQYTLEATLGRKVEHAELYMAHFLGAAGAGRFLDKKDSAPDARAAQLLPNAARSNQAVFYQAGRALTVDQVYAKFADKFGEAAEVAAAVPVPPTPAVPDVAATVATVAALGDGIAAGESNGSWSTFIATTPFGGGGSYRYLPAFALNILQQLRLPGMEPDHSRRERDV